MSSNNQVSISVETIQEIIEELKEISSLCSTPHLKMKVVGIQKVISSFLEARSKISPQDLIYEKMVEVKHLNPDLHLKLYMLYRNLTCSRISEVDAMSYYESYLNMFPDDEMIY
ncbi:hypothetical protein LGL55_02660 [Clostridium tagluense]|uniref:hypothetical protein n=1 Tax=Clostridium tagluense TaxID=360422 RepID=UPI001CF1F421|nr:hypothetical protein [Clostridium tagluense]MCB2310021.1 hypothetical protein [Clostridium tagluense]MCB2314449.1 hypothetical protein [Clostridium tagluense]MCB2319297.1 hypothetical protein [Clostridium tagluense]MCB2324615.1 hypothetical protein [Clostridium tagluense]MCB2329466.1 hypothetical protein [Clostridium tagluense]